MRAQLAEKVTEDRNYASRIGENAIRVPDAQLAACAETGRFRRELVPLIEFVTDRLEGTGGKTFFLCLHYRFRRRQSPNGRRSATQPAGLRRLHRLVRSKTED
jgi:hypothetical protein